jgi:hypothetical protein
MVTIHLPCRRYDPGHGFDPQPQHPRRPDLAGGFGCIFSTADEYETALISERRAQGRYDQPHWRWPIAMFAGCALMMAGTALLLN